MMEHGLRPTASARDPMTKHPSICPAKIDMATLSVSQDVRPNSARMWGRMRERRATSAASLAMVTQVTMRRKGW